MYTRPNDRRRQTHIPENYNGMAFSEEENIFTPPPTDIDVCCEPDEREKEIKKSVFPIKSSILGFEGEDLLLIALIFLLSQSDMANDILPLLIILLFC